MEDDETLASRRLGSVVGGTWVLERVLGTGGVGAVYAAKNASAEVAAIKILHSELARRNDVRERFLREGTLANRIEHDGALRVLEQGVSEEGTGYLVMELLEGDTLTQLVRKDGPLGVRELFGYIDQVLDVLIAAHAVGIVHRDLKPDNLFITTAGKLKVLDFGLARNLSDIRECFKTKTGLALGTLPYMAPEQARGRRAEVDGRADLFSLGATAFRVLARRKIHEAESEAELLLKMASEPAPKLGSVAPNVPVAAQQVVDLALAFTKEARYPDAGTMQRDVRDFLAGRPPSYACSRFRSADSETRVAPAIPAAPPTGDSQRVRSTAPLLTRPAKTEPLLMGTPMAVSSCAVPSPAWAPAPPEPAPAPRGPARPSAARASPMFLLWLTIAAVVLVAGAGVAFVLTTRLETSAETSPLPEQAPAPFETAPARAPGDAPAHQLLPAAAVDATRPSASRASPAEAVTARQALAEQSKPPAATARPGSSSSIAPASPLPLPAPKRAGQPETRGRPITRSSRLGRPGD